MSLRSVAHKCTCRRRGSVRNVAETDQGNCCRRWIAIHGVLGILGFFACPSASLSNTTRTKSHEHKPAFLEHRIAGLTLGTLETRKCEARRDFCLAVQIHKLESVTLDTSVAIVFSYGKGPTCPAPNYHSVSGKNCIRTHWPSQNLTK